MTCKWYLLCPLRRFERSGLLDQTWAEAYCKTDTQWKACRRYQLEEAGRYHPDNMLPDGSIDDNLD
ncbi:MAG: hypothetical protein R6U38_00675 [Desulfatiglandaceae bacterium]